MATKQNDDIQTGEDAERIAKSFKPEDDYHIQDSRDAQTIADNNFVPEKEDRIPGWQDAQRMSDPNYVPGVEEAEQLADEREQPPEDQSSEGQRQRTNDLQKGLQKAEQRAKETTDKAGKVMDKARKKATQGAEKAGKEAAQKTGKEAVEKAGEAAGKGLRAIRAGEAAASATGGGAVAAAGVELGVQGIKSELALKKALQEWNAEALKKDAKEKAKYALALLLIILIGILMPILSWVFVGMVIVALISMHNAESGEFVTIPLTLNKTGPTSAKAGDTLTYTISVEYAGAYNDITVVDTIPAGTTFMSSNNKVSCDNGPCNAASKSVIWKAQENNISSPVATTYTVVLRATVDNKWIVNIANGTAVAAATGDTGGGDPTSNDFVKLMTGQGRNVTVLGDENNFVSTIMKNTKGKLNVAGKEAQLRQLYRAAIQNNINPVILFAMWGVETGWSTTGRSFGCGVTSGVGSGFATQLACIVKAERPGLNGLMLEFTKRQKEAGGGPIKHPDSRYAGNCPAFTDPFIYAYELYTPVCAINDGNSNARANFVNYYKTAIGTAGSNQ